MCCFFTTLVVLGPRVAGVLWWLVQPVRWQAAFNNNWLWPVLGLIFLPWLTLMYVIVAPRRHHRLRLGLAGPRPGR